MFALKKTHPEVAAACGVTVAAVKHWKCAWRERRAAGLAARRHPGPTPNLSDDDLVRLEKTLGAGAHKAGFDSDLWTCPRVAQVIERRFGVAYHPAHVWKILQKLGWSCQKPERRARERDEAAIAHWRKVRWPAIKKGAATQSCHRICR